MSEHIRKLGVKLITSNPTWLKELNDKIEEQKGKLEIISHHNSDKFGVFMKEFETYAISKTEIIQ